RPGAIQWQHAELEGQAGGRAALKLSRLQELGYPAELLTRADLMRLEPELADTAIAEGHAAIHYPEDGYVAAPVFIGVLLDAAVRRYGAEVRTQTRVTEVLVQGDRAVGVTTAAGESLMADIVINCAGRWVNDVVGCEDLQVPLAPTVGLIAYTPA